MEETPKKPKKVEHKVRAHKCSETAQLDRMRLILVGNGDPTTGLVYLVKSSLAKQITMEGNISEIKDKVHDISKMYAETLSASQSAIRAIETYKSDEVSFKNGETNARKTINQKRSMFIVRFFEIVTIVIAMFMAYLGFKQYSKDQNEIIKEIQKMEISKPETPK